MLFMQNGMDERENYELAPIVGVKKALSAFSFHFLPAPRRRRYQV